MSSLPYPHPSNPHVSRRMRRNKRIDTGPEIKLRSALHRRGHRFRKHLPIRTPYRLVRPDVIFTRARIAVFVDGCFWHCCPIHGTRPRSNTDYWGPKLERNRMRDQAVDQALRNEGWTVLRAWEHEDPEAVADRIEAALRHA